MADGSADLFAEFEILNAETAYVGVYTGEAQEGYADYQGLYIGERPVEGYSDLVGLYTYDGYVMPSGLFADLKAEFYYERGQSHQYPGPDDVDGDAWGGVIVIDPLGKRVGAPTQGPIYILFDSVTIKPGLTDKSGVFHATINDNKTENHFAMYLFREGTEFIRDQDEFWIGIQRGPYGETPNPDEDLWSPAGFEGDGGAGGPTGPTEDFTTFNEMDAYNVLSQTANRSYFTGIMRGHDSGVLWKWYGVDAFGDFTHTFELTVTDSYLTAAAYHRFMVITYTSDLATWKDNNDNNKTQIGVMFAGRDTTYQVKAMEGYLGASQAGPEIDVQLGTTYYLEITKSGLSFRLRVYNDEEMTDLRGTSTITLGANHVLQDILCPQALELSGDPWDSDGYVAKLRLTPYENGDGDGDGDGDGNGDDYGSGRKWLMGGFISKRYYTIERKGRITAHIRGKCYMDLWKDQPFGTPDRPRSYKENPRDLSLAFYNLLDDVNAISGMSAHRQAFTPHPEYCPARSYLTSDADQGSAEVFVEDASSFPSPRFNAIIVDNDHPLGEEVTIWGKDEWMNRLAILSPYIQEEDGYRVSEGAYIIACVGLNLQKEFRNIPAFNVMKEFCEELGYEWKIDHLKQVWWYPRAEAPQATNYTIQYSENIRHVPEIMMGDTSELITDIIVKDAIVNTIPPELSGWISPEAWRDFSSDSKVWTGGLPPPPPNYFRMLWGDDSLVWDDEGYAALCYQKNDPTFDLNLTFSRKEGMPQMDIDMREWRRIKWKWRHATRPAPSGLAGFRWLTFIDYSDCEGDTVSLYLSREGVNYRYDYVEGVDWDRGASNSAAAASLTNAINLDIGLFAADQFVSVINIGSAAHIYPEEDVLFTALTTTDIYAMQSSHFELGEYWIYLMHDENRGFRYQFGRENSPQVANRWSNDDIVFDRTWTKMDLLLPVPEEDGTTLDANLRGWERYAVEGYSEYTGSIINYIRIVVNIKTDEEVPYYNYDLYTWLTQSAGPGDVLVWVNNPHMLAGYAQEQLAGDPNPNSPTKMLFHQSQEYMLYLDGVLRSIFVMGYNRDGFRPASETQPGGQVYGAVWRNAFGVTRRTAVNGNVLLDSALEDVWEGYAAEDFSTLVHPTAGYTISFSQIHFERNIRAEDTADDPLAPPFRYRVMTRPEMEYIREADAVMKRELEQDGMAKQWVRVVVDGDPEKEIGTMVMAFFDPLHGKIFNNLPMIIDDIELVLEAADFEANLLITPLDQSAKPRSLTEVEVLESHETKIEDLGKRKTPLTRTIRGESVFR